MTAVMSSPLRTAVVGLGYFGRFHARHHAANPDIDLVAVCDADGARASETAAEFGGEPVTDHRVLIGRVEAVSIAVPTSLHHDVARDFIDAGVHVLIEKPVTHDVDSADRLIALAEQRGVVLQVGHIERYSAAYKTLAGNVTRPLFIESRRLSPWKPRATDVDVVLDLMIHDIDIVLGLVGAPVESVQALGAPVLSASEDIANARINFADGTVADITASRISARMQRSIRVFQPDSYLVCDFADHRLARFTRSPEGGQSAEPIAMESRDIPREDSLGNEIAEFVACIREGRRPTVDGRTGREALCVAIMITDAIRAHRARIEASLA